MIRIYLNYGGHLVVRGMEGTLGCLRESAETSTSADTSAESGFLLAQECGNSSCSCCNPPILHLE